jgi:ParB family transcriptional regulator, chromosome partitioning protein
MILPEGEYCLIDVDQIEPNPHQPRINYSKEALDKLTQSIHENGLLQPIIVRKMGDSYQIIAGERRWWAYLLMDKQQIEAIVKSVDDQRDVIYALAENIAREDMSDYEIGKAIRRIEDNFPNKKDLAAMIGINRTDMYRYLAFDSLPDFILKDLDRNPKLLSRAAADQIRKVLSKESNQTEILTCLDKAWELLKGGKLKQTAIVSFIERKLKELASSDKDKEKQNNNILNKNGASIGQVSRTKKHWLVQLNANVINENQHQQILNFIQQLLNESTESVAS